MRIKHWFTRHNWKIVTAVYIPPVGCCWTPTCHDYKMAAYGFTEIIERCDCGARRFAEVLGNHSGIKSEQELEMLERMIQ